MNQIKLCLDNISKINQVKLYSDKNQTSKNFKFLKILDLRKLRICDQIADDMHVHRESENWNITEEIR